MTDDERGQIEHNEAISEAERLRAAIIKHHTQKADDRCWLNDDELYTRLSPLPGWVRA